MKFPLFARNGPCLARILIILLESHKFLHDSHDLTLDSHEILYHSHENIFNTRFTIKKRKVYNILPSKKAGKQPASLINNYFFKL